MNCEEEKGERMPHTRYVHVKRDGGVVPLYIRASLDDIPDLTPHVERGREFIVKLVDGLTVLSPHVFSLPPIPEDKRVVGYTEGGQSGWIWYNHHAERSLDPLGAGVHLCNNQSMCDLFNTIDDSHNQHFILCEEPFPTELILHDEACEEPNSFM